ncbi:MAG: hypothetical protein WC708_19100, partial [Lentisphaeria bacterium]
MGFGLLNFRSVPPRSATAAAAAGDPVRKWVIGGGFLVFLLVGGAVFGSFWWWYGWRIEPENGEFAVLIRKTGDNLPPEEILATRPGQKGIQLEVLPEGRYFRNPYTWTWQIHKITDIPAGKLAVQCRLFGKPLPSG